MTVNHSPNIHYEANIKPQPRALVLFSGGLDSQLVVCLLRQQKVAVSGIVFTSPFFTSTAAEVAAKQLNLPLIIEDFTEDIFALLKAPNHGFGVALNPCIDCHAAMLKRAGNTAFSNGFDFLATGDVLQQRPFSQGRKALLRISQLSGYQDLILRPLSAPLLPPTFPEREKMVNRSLFPSFSGRSRKPQMQLAQQFNLTDYPTPAGGCLLADRLYGSKLRDLMIHEGLDNPTDLERLRIGRHFRLPPMEGLKDGPRLIIGRNKAENMFLETTLLPGETLIVSIGKPGASGLLSKAACPADLSLAASLCARYSDHLPTEKASMLVSQKGVKEKTLFVLPAEPALVEKYRLPQTRHPPQRNGG